MASFSYNVMQDFYALKSIFKESGNLTAAQQMDSFADYADSVSKRMNTSVARTQEEYKTEFVKLMMERMDAEESTGWFGEEGAEGIAEAREYLRTL